jgi:hypothetical protein
LRNLPFISQTRIRAIPVFSVISNPRFFSLFSKLPNLSLTPMSLTHTIHSASFPNPVFYVNYRGFQIHSLCKIPNAWGREGVAIGPQAGFTTS